jgi:hypothetical protein
MPDASSIIRVSIIGDSKKLVGSLKDADKSIGGIGRTLGGGGLGGLLGLAGIGVGVSEAFGFVNDSLDAADRMGDAIGRLEGHLGKVDTKKITDAAEGFHTMGLSAPDVLDLSASFADIASSLGIAAPDIAKAAPELAGLAASIALAGGDQGKDVDQIIVDIGKAAGGADKPLQSLGIHLDEAAVNQQAMKDTGKTLPSQLTDTEKASARLTLITADLRDRFGETAGKTRDLEGAQKDWEARIETLQAKIGGPLSDAMAGLLDNTLKEIDTIGGFGPALASAGKGVADFAAFVGTPLGNVADVLRTILGLMGQIGGGAFQVSAGRAPRGAPGSPGTGTSESRTRQAVTRFDERNGRKPFIP